MGRRRGALSAQSLKQREASQGAGLMSEEHRVAYTDLNQKVPGLELQKTNSRMKLARSKNLWARR